MAQGDWNSFMQDKPTRVLLNALVAVICAFYAVDAVRELISPNDTSLMLIEQMGRPGYLALTVARLVVCVWVTISFVRQIVKIIKEDK